MAFEVKEGQYYYAPHRRHWGVWKKGKTISEFICDFSTKVQAEQFVYKMNGFKPKQ